MRAPLDKPQAIPKPEARQKTKARRQRADAKRAQAFRDAVWKRDDDRCRHCGLLLWSPKVRAPYPGYYRVGHVHHLRGRNVAPEDRYNPDKAVLLCQKCHQLAHLKKITL